MFRTDTKWLEKTLSKGLIFYGLEQIFATNQERIILFRKGDMVATKSTTQVCFNQTVVHILCISSFALDKCKKN